MKIQRISREDDFCGLKDRWNELLSESGLGNIFLTWEWMYSWWRVFKRKRDELFILCAADDSRITGIAPFFIRKNFYKRINFLGSGIACSDHLSFIANENDLPIFIKEIYEYLSQNKKEWDHLCLEGLCPDRWALYFLELQAQIKKLSLKKIKERIIFYLPLFSPVRVFENSLSRSLIKNIRYSERKLSHEGAVEWREFDSLNHSDLSANFEILVSLHQKRWQSLECSNGGLFNNDLFLKFLRIITQEFYKNGWLSLNLLYLEGKPIAANCNFAFNKKNYFYLTGFDPSFSAYGPGRLCLWKSIKSAVNKGYQEFDFLRGTDGYKLRWTHKRRIEYDILIIKRDLMGILIVLQSKFLTFIKKNIKSAIAPKLLSYIRAAKFNSSKY